MSDGVKRRERDGRKREESGKNEKKKNREETEEREREREKEGVESDCRGVVLDQGLVGHIEKTYCMQLFMH